MRPSDPAAGVYFQGGAPMLRSTQMVVQVRTPSGGGGARPKLRVCPAPSSNAAAGLCHSSRLAACVLKPRINICLCP